MKYLQKKKAFQITRGLVMLMFSSFLISAIAFGQKTELKKGYGMQDNLTVKTEQHQTPANSEFKKGYGVKPGSGSRTVAENDLCEDAILMTCNSIESGSTTAATFDDVGYCGTSNTAPGVWYTFQGDGSIVTVSTCSQANFDTKLTVFSGSCGALVCIDGNDDYCGLQSQLTFHTTQGVTYYILVNGFNTAIGDFNLTVTCAENVPVSNWAIFIGIFLIIALVVFRFRRIIS